MGSKRQPGRAKAATAVLLVAALVSVGLASTAVAKPSGTKTKGRWATTATVEETTTTVAETSTTDPLASESSTTTKSTTDSQLSTAELDASLVEAYDPVSALGSMYNVVDQIGARSLWDSGITGEGIDVAVIDTGVAPVPALTGADKVVAMVDLSFEAGVPEAVYLDTLGHGSHMAGIIAGRDPGADPATAASRPHEFLGVAPDAGIVSVKVGDNTGAVDVSQVIAGIDWVIEHGNDDGLNVRVINLSYGTDGTQDYLVDPLAHAVERAWDHGIVVVVAAGNDGFENKGLGNPAIDPYVIAVGGVEYKLAWGEYEIDSPWWATSGDTAGHGRKPDVGAPGAHIDSLRVPGSRIDVEHPEGYVSDTIFRGSGSSQAAAVVSGAAALLLSQRPELSPDQVKHLLRSTANGPRPGYDWMSEATQGEGVIDLVEAAKTPASDVAQTWPRSTGEGSLEASRGTHSVSYFGTVLEGEVTVIGSDWTGPAWEGASWTGASWTGASWTDAEWRGASWTGASWTGASWTGASWTGASWTGASWTGASWTGASWTGASWTGVGWE